MKVHITDGPRTVEIEATKEESTLPEMEEMALRLFRVATGSTPTSKPAGFNGWSSTSSTERDPES